MSGSIRDHSCFLDLTGYGLTTAATRPVLPVGVLSTRPDHAPLFILRPR